MSYKPNIFSIPQHYHKSSSRASFDIIIYTNRHEKICPSSHNPQNCPNSLNLGLTLKRKQTKIKSFCRGLQWSELGSVCVRGGLVWSIRADLSSRVCRVMAWKSSYEQVFFTRLQTLTAVVRSLQRVIALVSLKGSLVFLGGDPNCNFCFVFVIFELHLKVFGGF